jgi:hypothetical protein
MDITKVTTKAITKDGSNPSSHNIKALLTELETEVTPAPAHPKRREEEIWDTIMATTMETALTVIAITMANPTLNNLSKEASSTESRTLLKMD